MDTRMTEPFTLKRGTERIRIRMTGSTGESSSLLRPVFPFLAVFSLDRLLRILGMPFMGIVMKTMVWFRDCNSQSTRTIQEVGRTLIAGPIPRRRIERLRYL